MPSQFSRTVCSLVVLDGAIWGYVYVAGTVSVAAHASGCLSIAALFGFTRK